jgi:hypothetical protein
VGSTCTPSLAKLLKVPARSKAAINKVFMIVLV